MVSRQLNEKQMAGLGRARVQMQQAEPAAPCGPQGTDEYPDVHLSCLRRQAADLTPLTCVTTPVPPISHTQQLPESLREQPGPPKLLLVTDPS